MKINLGIGLAVAIHLLGAAHGKAADFDGDGVADEFTITRDAAKAARDPNVRLANPWEEILRTKQPPKGLGLIVRLSRVSRNYLVHDPEFFSSPMWLEGKPAVEVITKQDRRYRIWKKEVPALKGDAIQLGTEAGIDILLYWDGKTWCLCWPDEEP